MGFVSLCQDSFLQINTTKAKEMTFDFRKKLANHQQIVLKGENVEVVHINRNGSTAVIHVQARQFRVDRDLLN